MKTAVIDLEMLLGMVAPKLGIRLYIVLLLVQNLGQAAAELILFNFLNDENCYF